MYTSLLKVAFLLFFSDRYLYEGNEKFDPSFISIDPRIGGFKRRRLQFGLPKNVRIPEKDNCD